MDAKLRKKLCLGLVSLVDTRSVEERKHLIRAIEAFARGERVVLAVIGCGFELNATYDLLDTYLKVAIREKSVALSCEDDVDMFLDGLRQGYHIQWHAETPPD